MGNGMRIDPKGLPLHMQESIAIKFMKGMGVIEEMEQIEGQEEMDRIDRALAELVSALMEKYPEAVTATITITQGQVRISVALTESRVVKLAKM